MRRVSAEVNSAWPQENRFHFDILDLKEILVIEMSIQVNARFFIYTDAPVDQKNPDHPWRESALLDEPHEANLTWVQFNISPLHRGLRTAPISGAIYRWRMRRQLRNFLSGAPMEPAFGGSADEVHRHRGGSRP